MLAGPLNGVHPEQAKKQLGVDAFGLERFQSFK